MSQCPQAGTVGTIDGETRQLTSAEIAANYPGCGGGGGSGDSSNSGVAGNGRGGGSVNTGGSGPGIRSGGGGTSQPQNNTSEVDCNAIRGTAPYREYLDVVVGRRAWNEDFRFVIVAGSQAELPFAVRDSFNGVISRIGNHDWNRRLPSSWGQNGGYHLAQDNGSNDIIAHYDAFNPSNSPWHLNRHGLEVGHPRAIGNGPVPMPRLDGTPTVASQSYEEYCSGQ